MKNPLVRLFGGMAIGCLMMVAYFVGFPGATTSVAPLNGVSDGLNSQEVLLGLILSLIIFVFAGIGARDFQRPPVPHSSIQLHRQRRLRRLQRVRMKGFD